MKWYWEKQKKLGNICSIAPLSATNPTWTSLIVKHGEGPATNCQKHDVALAHILYME